MDSDKIEKVWKAMMAVRTITWEPSSDDRLAVNNAIQAAYRRLCEYAGGKALDLDNPDYLDLVCNAAWYIREERWPEFQSGYAEDLRMLRWREVFGCGVCEAGVLS